MGADTSVRPAARADGTRRETRGAGAAAAPRCARLVLAAAATLMVAAVPLAADEPCPVGRGCAEVSVTGPAAPVAVGATGTVALRLLQGALDGIAGGPDEIAALVLTLAIPGLELADCSAPTANGLTPAITLAPALADTSVFIVNTTCARRASCLCPDAGQPRDQHVNVVIAGPRELGPDTEIVPLPSGNLLGIALRVTPAAQSPVALHVFNAVDDDGEPAGGTLLNLADVLAADVTAAAGVSNVRVRDGELLVAGGGTTPSPSAPVPTQTVPPAHTATATVPSALTMTPTVLATATATALATETATAAAPACVGDCNGGGAVTVDELVVGVSIALGSLGLERCPAIDCNGNGQVTVACLVAAVNAALSACP